MKKRNVRLALKWSLPINVALLLLVLVDHFRWGGTYAIPLLVLYGLFLIWLIILLLLRTSSPLVRLPTSDEDRSITVYPRNHG